MRISELIKNLEVSLSLHGDLECVIIPQNTSRVVDVQIATEQVAEEFMSEEDIQIFDAEDLDKFLTIEGEIV